MTVAPRPRDAGAQLRDEALDVVARHEHVIGRDAGLSGVDQFPPRDPVYHAIEIARGINDGRRLTAQFQSDGGQIFGCRLCDFPADRGRSGKDEVIKG
jgi:hypothetical protein